jgi:magnesium-transporting ATPase (P-type)
VSIKAHLENKYLPLGIGTVVVLQMVFTYLPPFQYIFDTEAVPLSVWPWLLCGGLVFFFVVESEKFVIRARRGSRSADVVALS